MKVLLSSHIGKPWGGVTIQYENLLESSLKQKINLRFFENSVRQRSFSLMGKMNLENIFNAIIVLFKFTKELIKFQPQIVHIATAHKLSFYKNSLLVLVSKLFGKKVILAPHCSISVFLPPSQSFLWKYVLFILKKCDGLVVLSQEWLVLQENLPDCRIEYLPNAIDLKSYISINGTRKNEKIKILFLGHIGAEKGIYDLIDAVKILKTQSLRNYEINLLGESLRAGESENIIRLVDRYGLNNLIHFYPPEFGDLKIKRLAESDIYILPSHHEGMPISVIEAMASALPVIATKVGGIPDMIESGVNGLLVPKEDPVKLADSLGYLINNPEKRRQIGSAARKTALENHDVEKYVNKLFSFYQTLCSNNIFDID